MAQPPVQHPVQVLMHYVDRPEISEAFADVLRVGVAEGLNIKMEFVVNRADPVERAGDPIAGRSVTSCRLVMPLPGVLDMMNKLSGLLANLQAQGIIAPMPQAPVTIN